jgi:hypothetical protein
MPIPDSVLAADPWTADLIRRRAMIVSFLWGVYMQSILRPILAIMLALSLHACAGDEQASARPEPPPVEETVFGDMVGTMDKARDVEDAMKQQKEERDRAMEESEGQ